MSARRQVLLSITPARPASTLGLALALFALTPITGQAQIKVTPVANNHTRVESDLLACEMVASSLVDISLRGGPESVGPSLTFSFDFTPDDGRRRTVVHPAADKGEMLKMTKVYAATDYYETRGSPYQTVRYAIRPDKGWPVDAHLRVTVFQGMPCIFTGMRGSTHDFTLNAIMRVKPTGLD